MEKITFRPCIVALLVVAVCISCTGVVCAIDGGYLDDSTQTIHDWYNVTIYKQGTSGGFFGTQWGSASRLRIANIENYDDIYLFKIDMLKDANHIVSGSGGTFQAYSGATLVMSGDVFAWEATPTVYSIQFEPDYFSRGALSGTVELTLNLYGISITSNAKRNPGSSPIDLGHSADSGKVIEIISSQAWGTANYYTKINRYGITSDEENCLYIQRFDFTRQKPDGGWTYSHINLTEYDGSIIYHDSSSGSANVYNVSTITAPLKLIIEYGSPVVATHTYTWEGSSTCAPITPPVTPTPTPEIPGCDVDISLALSKYTSIFPYEYITGTATIDGDLPSGSSIRWMIGPGPGSTISKDTFAVFTNQSGTWYVTRNDLGIVSGPTPTTYEDALTEEVRFPDAGNYVVRVAVNTDQPCIVYDEKSLQVFPTSGVNLDFYGYDCLNGNVLGDMVMSIENLNITGPIVYTGNPIGVATNIGDILLINATSPGYTYSAFNYTVPNPPGGGTTLNVPVYLCPEEIGDIHPGNTTLVVNVKSQSTGEVIQGAYVSASGSGVSIASDHTNSMGYVMLQIPYRAGSTKVDVTAFPYVSQSKYLPLNNATMYEETFWMLYSGTPTPTPTQTYNPNATYTTTPTRTMTTAPTTTITTYPKLVVEVTDSRYGYTVPIAGASVKLYDGDEVDQTYKGELIQTAITATNGRTDVLQMTANAAYWIEVSKSGYYTSTERFRMSAFDSTRYVKLIPVGSNVTIATTSPTPGGNVYPDIGDGEATGWVAMFIEKVMELFGVNEWAARILLGLVATLIGAVFVGGCLAGFGSGEGAAMGALIGGCFGWVASCLLGFIPIWALIVSIAFVGMAFFVWHRAGGAGGG